MTTAPFIGHVGGNATKVRGQVNSANDLTRPADTVAYSAKDALADSTSVPNVWKFPNCGRVNGGDGFITKVLLLTDQAANTEGFRLHLYNVAPTAINDNAQCTAPLLADSANWVDSITLPACATEGTGATAAYAVDDASVRKFACAATDSALYGILETPNGFTPASGQKFQIYLSLEQN